MHHKTYTSYDRHMDRRSGKALRADERRRINHYERSYVRRWHEEP